MSVTTQDIINLIKTRGRGDPPSALADIFVNPIVKVLLFLDAKIDFAQAQQTVDTIILLLENDDALEELAGYLDETTEDLTTRLRTSLENIASNFGITRRAAAPSAGPVLLLRSDPLTVPPDTPITVPSGRRFLAPSLNQEYRTTSTVIITAMSFDDSLQKFVFSVPVQSINVGLDTVAGESQVSQIRDRITGIEGVTNSDPITGGRDEETDRELTERIKSALSANNIGTIAGYRNLVLGVAGVKDAIVISAGNPFMLRDAGDGGSVDIYITDPVPITVAELATSANYKPVGGKFEFSPSRQPIVDDANTIQPTDVFAINKDLGVYAGSVRAKDTITFNTDHTGETITYQTNDLVREVNDYMQDEERKIVGADVLIKEAVFVPVDVIATIQVLPEFSNSRDTVRDEVLNQVTQFITALNIGRSLEQSDVITLIQNVDGVDRVNIPMIKFERTVSTGVVNIIDALANEVLRPGNIIINF